MDQKIDVVNWLMTRQNTSRPKQGHHSFFFLSFFLFLSSWRNSP